MKTRLTGKTVGDEIDSGNRRDWSWRLEKMKKVSGDSLGDGTRIPIEDVVEPL